MKLLKLIEAAMLVTANGKICKAIVSPEIGDPQNPVLSLNWGKGNVIFLEENISNALDYKGRHQMQCMKGDWFEIEIHARHI